MPYRNFQDYGVAYWQGRTREKVKEIYGVRLEAAALWERCMPEVLRQDFSPPGIERGEWLLVNTRNRGLEATTKRLQQQVLSKSQPGFHRLFNAACETADIIDLFRNYFEALTRLRFRELA